VAGDEEDEISEVPRFLDVEAIAGLERPEPVRKPLANRVAAPVSALLEKGLGADDELDILGVVIHRAGKVPFVGGRELVEHNLHVRLRHGLPSIPAGPENRWSADVRQAHGRLGLR